MAIAIKTAEDIAGLRIAGRLAAELLDYLTPFVKPGVTTAELDKLLTITRFTFKSVSLPASATNPKA